ncbi:HAD family hydrolase [Nesterenkonia halophila]
MNTSSDTSPSDFAVPAAGLGGTFVHQQGKLMVCLDVDGTLVDHDGHMSEAVKQSARAVVGDGHAVVVATGRSLPATLPIIEALGVTHGYAVCSNGGVTVRIDVDLPDGHEVIDRRVFDPAPALDALAERLPYAKYAIETDDGGFLSTQRFQDMSFGLQARGTSFREMRRASAVRLVVNSDDSTSDDFAAAVEGIGLHGVTYSVGWSAWLDVAAAGVTKASSLEALRDQLAVPERMTVACGDGRNDLEMLRWAARGVAMGQAPQEVKEASDEVTGTVWEDGLVEVLTSVLTVD